MFIKTDNHRCIWYASKRIVAGSSIHDTRTLSTPPHTHYNMFKVNLGFNIIFDCVFNNTFMFFLFS